MEVLRIISCSVLLSMGITLFVFGMIMLISEFKEQQRCKKIQKRHKLRFQYPYLPLDMVTKHYGWSYEYIESHGWCYIIWYVPGFSGNKYIVYTSDRFTRAKAIEDCLTRERIAYGGEEHD